MATQILINSDFLPNAQEFQLHIKFWSVKLNGFVEISSTWEASYNVFNAYFKKLNNPDYTIKYLNKLLVERGYEPELKPFNLFSNN